MFNFRFKKEDPFKFRQKENSVECDVLPNFKPVPLEAVEDSLRALKESKSLSSIEEEQIRNTFFADKQEGLKGIVDLIDNSKLSFFRKYDLKSSIAKEAGFKVSMPPPKNISDTTTPILEEINSDLEYGEISTNIVQEHPNVIHRRLTEALRGGYRKPSDLSVPLPSAGSAKDSDVSINDGGDSSAVSLLTEIIAVLAASSIVSRPSRKVREAKRKDRDKALLIKSRLASVRNILDSAVDFLSPVRVYRTLPLANINPILLLVLNGTLYFSFIAIIIAICILVCIAVSWACITISQSLLPGLNFGVVQRFYRELFVRIIGTTITLSLIPNIPPVLRSFTQLITGWASYLLPQQFRGDLVTSQQQPEEGLQLDDPISENGDAEKEVTILTYVDRSFEQDLTFIDGLVKTRSRSFLSDSSQLEFEKVLSKYMIILWSLEAYPDLITGIEPEDRSQIQEFVEKKLLDFAKGEDSHFSPNIFMKALRKTSEAGMSELDFAQRDHIIEPFKVKIVKDQEVISRRKRIINGLISEITLQIPTKLK
jgi:hypothetical protein